MGIRPVQEMLLLWYGALVAAAAAEAAAPAAAACAATPAAAPSGATARAEPAAPPTAAASAAAGARRLAASALLPANLLGVVFAQRRLETLLGGALVVVEAHHTSADLRPRGDGGSTRDAVHMPVARAVRTHPHSWRRIHRV